MQLKICDRCGAEIPFSKKPSINRVEIIMKTGIFIKSTWESHPVSYDICKDCCESFDFWLRSGSKKENVLKS